MGKQDRVHLIAERAHFVAVFPNAWNDSPKKKRWTGGWGQHGHEGEPGRHGRICHKKHSKYACYTSCKKKGICGKESHSKFDCHSGSCVDDDLFVHTLLNDLLANLCLDANRIHATGMSAGAIFLYGLSTSTLGNHILSRLASLVLVAGS